MATKNSTSPWYTYITLLAWIDCAIVSCQQVNNMLEYNLMEEDPGGTIANIATDSGFTQIYSASELEIISFRFLSQGVEYQDSFRITDNGILQSVRSIDRDAICRHSSVCNIQFDIATEPREYFQIIKVTIHIEDINDNAPRFDENSISLSIPETTVSGTAFALPSAYDEDIGQYGIQTFALEPQLTFFALDANINPDGSLDLHLILANSVDRELNQNFNLRVITSDGGNPARTGILNIAITIIDSNDNNPKFLNNTYQVTVDENIGIGRSIFQMQAFDPDEGSNGEVTYYFSRSTENAHGDLFGIEETSGYVFTKDTLDYELGELYILSIKATDGGITPLSSYTKLNVLVNDLNDNPPEIRVNALHGLHAEIPENAGINDFVAQVVIDDKDSGPNGEITCSMSSSDFVFEHLYGNEYQILTKSVYDRERQDEYSLELVCADNGRVPLVTKKTIPVYITDTNDHSPKFSSDRYTVTIDEQNALQAYIATISARDEDADKNAELSYSIQQTNPAPRSHIEALTIDSSLGIIYANEIFDHEGISEYDFIINAIDGGSPSRMTTTYLHLIITDINDEPPEFSQENYIFGTYENQAPDTEIGTLIATDRDDSEQYRDISFDLDSRFSDVTTFGIDTRTGKIVAKKVLDREAKAEHYLLAIAFNTGFALSSSVNITIHVADKNDNAPVMVFPGHINNTVEIKGNHRIQEKITNVVAYDLDIATNAELTYGIVFGNENDYFEINTFNGEITLKNPLGEETFNKVIEIVILVEDGGSPTLSTTETLNVFINGTFITSKSEKQRDEPNNNVAIIIICVLVFVIICIILVLVMLFFVRRTALPQCHRRNTGEPKYDCHVENAKNSSVEINTSSQSLPSEFSDPANRSFGGGKNISYISADDASFQSMYMQQRFPAHSAVVDGYCPAGTLVSEEVKPSFPRKQHFSSKPSGTLQLQVPTSTIRDAEQESDSHSLTDSGKGSSEGDAIQRISPLDDMRRLPVVQNAGFVRDNTCSIYKADARPPNLEAKPPFQTYLTDNPHTTPCRQSPDRALTPNTCEYDKHKKSVHFSHSFSEKLRHSDRSVTRLNINENLNVYSNDNQSNFHRNPSMPYNTKVDRKEHVPSHYMSPQARNNPTSRLQRGNNIPESRQVINLSQYLSERRRDSDGDSHDGYSGGSTTTSGSYCMDDEDLAHDVLV